MVQQPLVVEVGDTSCCVRKRDAVMCYYVVTPSCNDDGSLLSRVIRTRKRRAFPGSVLPPCILLDDGDGGKNCCYCRFVVGGLVAAVHASGAVGHQIVWIETILCFV